MTAVPSEVPKPRSFLRNFVPVLAFMLLCGVVGPMFLVAGLVVDAPDTAWLLPTGIVVTALDVLVAFLVARGRTRKQQRMYHLRTRGRTVVGRVLSFEETNVRINDQPVVVIRLRIEGEDLTPFDAERRTVVPAVRLPVLHTGELPVLVDPETREWEIDWSAARPVLPTPLAPIVEERSAAERLAELDDLLARDLVTREEYDATRARILGAI